MFNFATDFTKNKTKIYINMYTTITAAEAASLIKNGVSLGLSGFTPAGSPKAVTRELAKIAEEEHAKGNEFKVNLFTGASTGQSTDGVLS